MDMPSLGSFLGEEHRLCLFSTWCFHIWAEVWWEGWKKGQTGSLAVRVGQDKAQCNSSLCCWAIPLNHCHLQPHEGSQLPKGRLRKWHQWFLFLLQWRAGPSASETWACFWAGSGGSSEPKVPLHCQGMEGSSLQRGSGDLLKKICVRTVKSMWL